MHTFMPHDHNNQGYQFEIRQIDTDRNLLNLFQLSLYQDLGSGHLEDFTSSNSLLDNLSFSKSLKSEITAVQSFETDQYTERRLCKNQAFKESGYSDHQSIKALHHRGPPH